MKTSIVAPNRGRRVATQHVGHVKKSYFDGPSTILRIKKLVASRQIAKRLSVNSAYFGMEMRADAFSSHGLPAVSQANE
jgi:hypothetical protein